MGCQMCESIKEVVENNEVTSQHDVIRYLGADIEVYKGMTTCPVCGESLK